MAVGDRPPTGAGVDGTPLNGPVRTTQGPPSPVSGSNKFDVNYTALTGLRTEVQGLVTDLKSVDDAVKTLANTLKTNAGAFSMIGGTSGGPRNAGGQGLSVAGFSGGGSGGTTTPAGFSGAVSSGMSKFATGLTVATFGGLAADAAGAVGSYMNKITGPGMASNLMSTQQNAIFGGGTNQSGPGGVTATSQAWSRLPNLSQSDLAGAQSILSSQWFTKGGAGSARMANNFSFMKQAEKMAPGMGATQAAQFGSTLTSAGAMWASNRYLGANKGILVNPNGSVNSGQQTFQNLLQVVTKGQSANMTPAQLKNLAKQDNVWAGIAQNFGQGTPMGLTDQDITMLQQYAAAGGSTAAAAQAVSRTPAATSLNKTTAKTRLDQSSFQGSVRGRNAVNQGMARVYNAGANYADANPSNVNAAYLASTATHAALSFADALASTTQKLLDFGVAVKYLKGKFGGGGGGGAGAGGEGAADTTATDTTATVAGGAGAAAALPFALTGGAALALGKYGPENPNRVIGTYDNGKKKLTIGGMQSNIAAARFGLPVDGSTGNIIGGSGWEMTGNGWQRVKKGQKFDSSGFGYGDPPTGSTTTHGMTPTMAKRIAAMQQVNPHIQITSGHRSASQQAFLYKAKGGRGVAPVGQSAHQRGMAADLGPPSQLGWIARNASKFGLSRPDPSGEPWHVQAMGDPTSTVTGAQIVAAASSFEGTPYVWGGGNSSGVSHGTTGDSADPNAPNQIGLDCSGLVVAAYGKMGIKNLPRTSEGMASIGTKIASISQAQPGDLLIYSYGATADHVAIYIGSGKQIAAPYTGKTVEVESVDTGHLYTIRRVIGGGAGKAVVQSAQSLVGTSSVDAQAHATGGSGLNGSFLQTISSSWLNSGMGAYSGGGGSGSMSTVATAAATNTSGAGTGAGTSTTPNLSTTPTAQGYLSASAVYQLAIQAGLSPKNAQIATAVANVESKFNPNAVDHDSNGTTDYGLWQINSVHGVGTNMFSPTMAAAEMAKLTNKGSNWGPWAPDFGSSTYGGNPAMGGKVQAAMTALGFMGDPMMGGGGGAASGFTASPVALRGAKVPGMGGSIMGGGGNITVNAPITVASASAQEAQRFVQMVVQELKNQTGIDAMAGN